MSRNKKINKFKLAEIDEFDARWSGYKKCVLPGVGVSFGSGYSKADSDFWRDPEGNLAIRISSGGYSYNIKATLDTGDVIPDEILGDFGEYFTNVLMVWVIEGIDDLPTL